MPCCVYLIFDDNKKSPTLSYIRQGRFMAPLSDIKILFQINSLHFIFCHVLAGWDMRTKPMNRRMSKSIASLNITAYASGQDTQLPLVQ
jgi:hypothetical protein